MKLGHCQDKTMVYAILGAMTILSYVGYMNADCPGGCSCSSSGIMDCRDGELTSVQWHLANAEAVREMYLGGNKIHSIIVELGGYINLELLDISNNQLSQIDGSVFTFLPKLKELKLSGNRLTDITNLTSANLPSLNSLLLDNNYISQLEGNIFVRMPALEDLDLSNNDISEISDKTFQGLNQLRTLNLSSNSLEEVPVSALRGLASLHTLNLGANSISTIPDSAFDGNMNLEQLYLNGNTISYISTIGFEKTNLQILDLSDNNFETFPEVLQATDLRHLASLDLSANKIKEIPKNAFTEMHRLKTLKLRYMPHLEAVQSKAFPECHSLQVLDIYHNQNLRFIDEQSFIGCSSLKILHLQYNALETLHESSFDWRRLQEVDLRGNKFNCDCNMRWLPTMLAGFHRNLSNSYTQEVTCTSPEVLSGNSILGVAQDQLICDTSSSNTLLYGILAGSICITIIITAVFIYRFREKFYHGRLRHRRFKNHRNLKNQEDDEVDVLSSEAPMSIVCTYRNEPNGRANGSV